jgi:hypothetical protein
MDVMGRLACTVGILLFAANTAASGGPSHMDVSATVVRSLAVSVTADAGAQPVVSVRTASGSTWSAPLGEALTMLRMASGPEQKSEPEYLVVTVLADGPALRN